MGAWAGLIWLRKVIVLVNAVRNLRFPKYAGDFFFFFWLADELLAFQEGPYYMELVMG